LKLQEVEVVQYNEHCTGLWLMNHGWIPAMVQKLVPWVNGGATAAEDYIHTMDAIGVNDGEQ
jgi:hypothetical protein